MPLRLRLSDGEVVLPDEQALAALYRERRVLPSDLIWHPGGKRWVRIDAFLFMDLASPPPPNGVTDRRPHHGSGGGGNHSG
jgi:hypothetical protein